MPLLYERTNNNINRLENYKNISVSHLELKLAYFHLIFSVCSRLWVTEIVERKTTEKEDSCGYRLITFIFFS